MFGYATEAFPMHMLNIVIQSKCEQSVRPHAHGHNWDLYHTDPDYTVVVYGGLHEKLQYAPWHVVYQTTAVKNGDMGPHIELGKFSIIHPIMG